MRRLILAAALAACVMACRKKEGPATIEGPIEMQSGIRAADPRVAVQFVKGFHQVEASAWRWTARSFAVTLKVPKGASATGATLKLDIAVPEPVIQKLGATTLKARIGTTDLEPETFSTHGNASYSREVPAAALASDVVLVEFSCDKFFEAGSVDQRELAMIVSGVSLTTKK